jgi:HAE1 family hydrophobic/amphiphilic exporter-1
MISRFFIDRPVFANVIAIVTVLFGVVALFQLPVERRSLPTRWLLRSNSR